MIRPVVLGVRCWLFVLSSCTSVVIYYNLFTKLSASASDSSNLTPKSVENYNERGFPFSPIKYISSRNILCVLSILNPLKGVFEATELSMFVKMSGNK